MIAVTLQPASEQFRARFAPEIVLFCLRGESWPFWRTGIRGGVEQRLHRCSSLSAQAAFTGGGHGPQNGQKLWLAARTGNGPLSSRPYRPESCWARVQATGAVIATNSMNAIWLTTNGSVIAVTRKRPGKA